MQRKLTTSLASSYSSYDSTPLLDRATPENSHKKVTRDDDTIIDKKGHEEVKFVMALNSISIDQVESKRAKWEKLLENLNYELWVLFEDSKMKHEIGAVLAARLRENMFAKRKEIVEYARANSRGYNEMKYYCDRSYWTHAEFAHHMGLPLFDEEEHVMLQNASWASPNLKLSLVEMGEESEVGIAHAEHENRGEQGAGPGAELPQTLSGLEVEEGSTTLNAANVELAHRQPLPSPASTACHGHPVMPEGNSSTIHVEHGQENLKLISTTHPCSPFDASATHPEREEASNVSSEDINVPNGIAWENVEKPEEKEEPKVEKHEEIHGYGFWKRLFGKRTAKVEEEKEK